MLGLTLCLIVLPYLYGRILLGNEKKDILLRFPFGFMVELTLWTAVSFPIVFLKGEFSKAVFIFECCNLPCLVYGVVLLYRFIRNRTEVIKDKNEPMTREQRILFAIVVAFVLFQAGCASFFQTPVYRDSKAYIAMVNDTVETNGFFTLEDSNGTVRADAALTTKKYRLSSWYTFEAVLSKVGNLHPLIVVNTVLPGYLIILYYILLWYLIGVFIEEKSLKYLFLIAVAFLNGVFSDDISQIILHWPTWGKNITATIAVPLIIIVWSRFLKKRDIQGVLNVFLLMAAGCAVSNMGIMILPIELSFLTIVELVMKKKIDWKLVLQVVVMMIPVGIFTILMIR